MSEAGTGIPKAYEAKAVEEKWYAHWLDKGCFTADPRSARPAYSIVIPPPNVTGVLTMGHVLNNTLQDILARRKRMQGFEVLWLPGTDHAGIATQTVVEKTLRKQKVIRHRNDLGREKFLEKVWEWKEKHGGIIIQQLKKLGSSCDWTRERFTMDEAYSKCVLQVFVDLYKKGLIYRGKRMVNWCPVSRTALSDEEVIMKEVDGHLWYIKYPIVRGSEEWKNGRMEAAASAQSSSLPPVQPSEFLIVATTRPETMLGDEAVAVNPGDERYQRFIGRKLLLPLKDKEIPVIADETVDPKFGTGCVKVTPAHDPADYDMGLRHKLPFTVVIGYDGIMTEEAGEPFAGLDRAEARDAVVKELEEDGLLLKVEPYKHNVGYSERADVPVEPMISEQWFLKYPSAEKSRAAVASGEIKFYPERWAKVYDHWLADIRDWCISRQLWWGHRIPVWYRKTSSSSSSSDIHVGIEPPSDPENWVQDEDVLDTWFSSWLWPFATMGWPEKTDTLEKFYPTTDLVTGPDIIFFWVARMIMAGNEFMGQKPFSNVYFTGIIRDSIGRKMSKSLGNSPDPLDLIARYGADGLRFGMMLIAPQGQDILFDEKRMEIGRNFCNKLWNACRLRQMQESENGSQESGASSQKAEVSDSRLSKLDPGLLSSDDRFILLQLDATIREVSRALDAYEFNAAAQALYQFFWSRYCDWYLEASKSVLWAKADVGPLPSAGGTEKTTPREGTRPTADIKVRKANTLAIMDIVLSNILRLLHPYMPFITEELWQGLGYSVLRPQSPVPSTIMFAPWPVPFDEPDKTRLGLTNDVAVWTEAKYALIGVGRNLRSEYQVAPGKKVRFIIKPGDSKIADQIRNELGVIALLLTASEVEVDEGFAAKQGTPTGVEKLGILYMPLEGAVDLDAEKARLTKELDRARKDLEMAEAKLNNPSFRDRAPKDIVRAQEKKRDEIQQRIRQLEAALKNL